MLPRSVLISPLCATKRYGCASGHDGNVLVLNRWCTSASADCRSVVGQVREHRLELPRRQHALVDQRVRRQADDVEEAARERVHLQRVDGVLDALADDVQLALERARASVGSRDRRTPRAPMNTCWKTGCVARALSPTRRLSVGTSRQPSSVCPSSSAIRAIRSLMRVAVALVVRQEHEAGAVRAGGRQRERARPCGGRRPASGSGCRRRRRCSPRSRRRRGARD